MNSARTGFKEEPQTQERVGPRRAGGKDLSQLLCVSAAGLVLLRAWMLPWSCPVVALDGRRAAVPENLLLPGSRALQTACAPLHCEFCVTYCQGEGSLSSCPDWRHELQMSHTESNLPLQGVPEMHRNQRKISALT